MRKQKWGRVIYSSSICSVRGSANEGLGVYAATKAGLNAFAQYVAPEAGDDGITANTLIIGIFQTAMMEEFLKSDRPEEKKRAFVSGYSSMTSVGRVGKPMDMAGMVQLLASDAGAYISGALLPVDGGITSTLRPMPSVNTKKTTSRGQVIGGKSRKITDGYHLPRSISKAPCASTAAER